MVGMLEIETRKERSEQLVTRTDQNEAKLRAYFWSCRLESWRRKGQDRNPDAVRVADSMPRILKPVDITQQKIIRLAEIKVRGQSRVSYDPGPGLVHEWKPKLNSVGIEYRVQGTYEKT